MSTPAGPSPEGFDLLCDALKGAHWRREFLKALMPFAEDLAHDDPRVRIEGMVGASAMLTELLVLLQLVAELRASGMCEIGHQFSHVQGRLWDVLKTVPSSLRRLDPPAAEAVARAALAECGPEPAECTLKEGDPCLN